MVIIRLEKVCLVDCVGGICAAGNGAYMQPRFGLLQDRNVVVTAATPSGAAGRRSGDRSAVRPKRGLL